MKTTLEGKASEKDTGKAVIIKSIGASIMFVCIGVALIILALNTK